MSGIHMHEFFYTITDGLRANWPAESCLGALPRGEARRLLGHEELTITPHGTVAGVTTWRQVKGSPQACWLAGRGFVL